MNTNQLPPEFFDFLKEMPAVIEAVKQIPMLVEAVKLIPAMQADIRELLEAVKPIPVMQADIHEMKSDIHEMKSDIHEMKKRSDRLEQGQDYLTKILIDLRVDSQELKRKTDTILGQTAVYGEIEYVVNDLKEQVTSTFDGFTEVLLNNKSKAV